MASADRLRYVDATRRRGWLYRAWAGSQGSLFAGWVSRLVAWRLDPILLRISGGRLRMTLAIPSALLDTTGAKTGELRRHGVIYFHDGARVIVVASHAGAPTHPAWFHNAVAHPDVELNGIPFRASVVIGEDERTRLWILADRVFPPFATYRARAAATGRTIPILELTPRSPIR
jgi:deazaflavin-dependent oxidoreductase (nitroreductase family)